jgi:hypothetical protein
MMPLMDGASSKRHAEKRQAWCIGPDFQQMFTIGIPIDNGVERWPADLDNWPVFAINADADRRSARGARDHI